MAVLLLGENPTSDMDLGNDINLHLDDYKGHVERSISRRGLQEEITCDGGEVFQLIIESKYIHTPN